MSCTKFSVRPGLKWSKGFGDVTAEDVKYSFERMPARALAAREPYRTVDLDRFADRRGRHEVGGLI